MEKYNYVIFNERQKEGKIFEYNRSAKKKYFDNNYKQVKLSMPISEAEKLETYCKNNNYSKAGFIREAIKEKIERSENK